MVIGIVATFFWYFPVLKIGNNPRFRGQSLAVISQAVGYGDQRDHVKSQQCEMRSSRHLMACFCLLYFTNIGVIFLFKLVKDARLSFFHIITLMHQDTCIVNSSLITPIRFHYGHFSSVSRQLTVWFHYKLIAQREINKVQADAKN